MIDMTLLQTWWGKFHWLIALVGCAVLAYFARGFGKTAKQEDYKRTLEDFKAKKLDEILIREQYALEQRDQVIETGAKNARGRVIDLAEEMERISVEQRARIPHLTPRDLGEAMNK